MRYLFIVLLLFVANQGIAQKKQSYTFTLQDAIDFAMSNNRTAINAKRDVMAALKQKWEATAAGLPQIDGNVDYQNQLKQPVSLVPAEFAGGAPGTFIPVIFGVPQTVTATATLNQKIFDGSYLVGLQASKTFLAYSKNAEEKTSSDLRKEVINAYGNVLLAKENISILENNKEALEKNLKETREIFQNGMGEEEDVEQLQITHSNMGIQLANAKRVLELSNQLFNITLGIDLEVPVVLTESLDVLIEKSIRMEILSAELDLARNIDYKIAHNLTEQRRLEYKLEKSKYLPTLNAFVNYGTAAYSSNFNFFNGNQQWFQSSVLGVSLKVPIFSSFDRKAKTQRAAIALDKAKTDLESAIQQAKLATETAKNDYQFAVNKYENAKSNLALAERIENKNQVKFFEGLSSSFDLRQAQLQLYTAQQEFLQSMLDVINNKAELERILNLKN